MILGIFGFFFASHESALPPLSKTMLRASNTKQSIDNAKHSMFGNNKQYIVNTKQTTDNTKQCIDHTILKYASMFLLFFLFITANKSTENMKKYRLYQIINW